MSYADMKARLGAKAILEKTDLLGYFDFYSSIVTFDSLEIADVQRIARLKFSDALMEQDYTALARVMPLAAHEYTHFIDATSTLWGLNHQLLMNRAYLSDQQRQQDTSNFHHAKTFRDHIQRIRMPDYYTIVTPNESGLPWEARPTAGKLFDSRGRSSSQTIMFARFTNSADELFARSPISAVSILEASAMAQQLLLHSVLVSGLGGDFGLVEKRDFGRRTVQQLYNKELTEYSVCAHLVANRLACPDALEGFAVCSVLTRLVLNLPGSAYDYLSRLSDLGRRLRIDDQPDFVESLRDGLRHRDMGTAFFVLTWCLDRNPDIERREAANAVKGAAERLGLDLQIVRRDAEEQARAIADELSRSAIEFIPTIGRCGLENFLATRTDDTALEFSRLHLPLAMLSDSHQATVMGNPASPLIQIDLEELYEEMFQGQQWVERFSEACV